MRTSSRFRGNATTNLRPPPIPDIRLALFKPVHRRRLDDALEAVFNRACATNNLDAAADVLTVLEKWHGRRVAGYGRERRISDMKVKTMRSELVRLTASRIS